MEQLTIIRIARELYRKGWMEGTAGNISVRLPADGKALITISGRGKGELTSTDGVVVRIADSTPVHLNGPRPSAETTIHTALYRRFPDCGAVVHAHPPHATALAALAARRGDKVVSFEDLEIIKGLGITDSVVDIPVFPNYPHVPEIAAEIAEQLADDAPPVLLIGSHGATSWGPDLATARNRLECLEALCQLEILLRSAS